MSPAGASDRNVPGSLPPEMRRAGVLLLIVFGALLGPASASAAPTWLASSRLSSSKEGSNLPDVAMDVRGNSVAVWSAPEGPGVERIEASVRPAGGSWSGPVPLSPEGAKAQNPQVAVDDAGEATVVWSQEEGATTELRSVSMAAGSGWTPAANVSTAGDEPVGFDLAVGRSGEAIVAYEDRAGPKPRARVTTRLPGGGWTEAVTVSAAGEEAYAPSVSLGNGGTAAVVWPVTDGVRAVERPVAGAWSKPVDVVTGEGLYSPAIAVAPDGEVVAVWRKSENGKGAFVQSASETGGIWSPPQELGVGFFYSGAPRIEIDAGGEAVALWERSESSALSILAASRPRGGAWSAPTELSHPGEAASYAPNLAIGLDGQVAAVWLSGELAKRVVTASVRPVGGSWNAPTDLTAPGAYANEPVVAADAHGDAVATWESGETATTIEAAGFDGAGPELRSASIPSSGTTGTPAPFSVDAVDVWSGVTVAWTFGDGAGASGASVSHTYGAPGQFPIALTATDGSGNSTSASGAITVALAKAAAVRFRRAALVRNGRAALVLTCPSVPCTGLVELRARSLPRHAKTKAKHPSRLRLAGKSPFKISTAHATVKVKLRPFVLTRLQSAASHQLKVRLQGQGIQAGPLTLRLPRHHHRHR